MFLLQPLSVLVLIICHDAAIHSTKHQDGFLGISRSHTPPLPEKGIMMSKRGLIPPLSLRWYKPGRTWILNRLNKTQPHAPAAVSTGRPPVFGRGRLTFIPKSVRWYNGKPGRTWVLNRLNKHQPHAPAPLSTERPTVWCRGRLTFPKSLAKTNNWARRLLAHKSLTTRP